MVNLQDIRAIEIKYELGEEHVSTTATPLPKNRTYEQLCEWVPEYFDVTIGYRVAGSLAEIDTTTFANDVHECIIRLLSSGSADVATVTYDSPVGQLKAGIQLVLESTVEVVDICDEMKTSYADYAMSVIIGRALPDARDGLKPVHRRSLFAMHELKNLHNLPYKKSARVVGDVIGKYHPHGDSSVYDTLVRMAQPFSLRYPLVDGQGNFGSIDGDSAAAMRYTEIRMEEITAELTRDLEYGTVDYVPNYDGTLDIPEIFPARFPNLLVNGSSGIAVGMATNIPPHNMSEILEACQLLLDNPNATDEELFKVVSGPDFPTGGIIYGDKGIYDAYRTGRGKIYLRGVADIEETKGGREHIVISEIPYQVNKARLIEKIAELVKTHKLEGISGLRDESDRDGMRIVIDIKRDAIADIVLNNLYSYTQLQTTFGMNMVALSNGRPKLFTLRGLLEEFIRLRYEVVTRRSVFLRDKAIARKHILDGFVIAQQNIDKIVETIRESSNSKEAQEALCKLSMFVCDPYTGNFSTTGMAMDVDGDFTYVTPKQAEAIVNMRLYQLTSMETTKIDNERKDLITDIKHYTKIIESTDALVDEIELELEDIANKYADKRLTDIDEAGGNITIEDLIENERVVLTLSSAGYVKYQPVSEYNAQRRGGQGKSAASMKEDDYMTMVKVCDTHDSVLCFSSIGKVYSIKVHQLPAASRGGRGKPIVNILPVIDGEVITTILPVKEFDSEHFVFMATESGVVKKVCLDSFSNLRSTGIIAISLNDGDILIGARITTGDDEVMLFSDNGKVVRFSETTVRAMGRSAVGVRGMKLLDGGRVVSLVIPEDGASILTATENGYGKQTPLDQYPIKGRATQGVVSIKVTPRNGLVVGAIQVNLSDTVMMVTNSGKMIRTAVNKIASISRNTQGVILMDFKNDKPGTVLVGMSRVAAEEEVAE